MIDKNERERERKRERERERERPWKTANFPLILSLSLVISLEREEIGSLSFFSIEQSMLYVFDGDLWFKTSLYT